MAAIRDAPRTFPAQQAAHALSGTHLQGHLDTASDGQRAHRHTQCPSAEVACRLSGKGCRLAHKAWGRGCPSRSSTSLTQQLRPRRSQPASDLSPCTGRHHRTPLRRMQCGAQERAVRAILSQCAGYLLPETCAGRGRRCGPHGPGLHGGRASGARRAVPLELPGHSRTRPRAPTGLPQSLQVFRSLN